MKVAFAGKASTYPGLKEQREERLRWSKQKACSTPLQVSEKENLESVSWEGSVLERKGGARRAGMQTSGRRFWLELLALGVGESAHGAEP